MKYIIQLEVNTEESYKALKKEFKKRNFEEVEEGGRVPISAATRRKLHPYTVFEEKST